jgi:hypothetical protein
MSDHITISPSTLAGMCNQCKTMLTTALGLSISAQGMSDPDLTDDAGEIAELGLQAARLFLRGCNDKTRNALEEIVKSGDHFSLRALEKTVGVGVGELKGVWTGLTKRVRTITGDDEALLIDWSDETDDGDYTGCLHPTTRNSFERAIGE